jgi:putative heme-binding domain-containing protein
VAKKWLATLIFSFVSMAPGQLPHAAAQNKDHQPLRWIWLDKNARENQTVYFRRVVALQGPIVKAVLQGTCDNQMSVFINDREAVSSDNWQNPVSVDVTDLIRRPAKTKEARIAIAVKAQNSEGPAGLLLRLVIDLPNKKSLVVATDDRWRVSAQGSKGWQEPGFDDSAWGRAIVVARLGDAPWGNMSLASAGLAGKLRRPTATPIELIKAKKDYKVELLYSVPRETQGSWVSMCVDPKGRLITSDQVGRLYRITPPPIGGNVAETRVEQLPVDLGEAQGLLWAFDSLYVVVNGHRKYESGLWRVTSSKGDDTLDTKEKLRGLAGGGEHGPHAVLPGPDRKSLYVLCGNHTRLTELSGSMVPRIWGEDYLVPRLWDASGHAVGILAPGGCVYKVDPAGKKWVLISMGYRNAYDAAFNRDGELFVFDSDMEWDMNTPWYRPTRVCHAVPGSEFGWRGGTGKMYEYHPDNLPPVVNVGPGSPTGVIFGYGAKFPAKYQNALYLCDWSYGKLYAAHLKPAGSTYTAELEEFLNGSPLPLTDIVVSPKDGAMYFTIGGRNTMSGLYRITYTGNESTEAAAADHAGARERAVRKKLEALYAHAGQEAIATAWPFLSSNDRFLRYAARTVLEFRDPKTWQAKALSETNPVALTHALIGLARAGSKDLLPQILEALERVRWNDLTSAQKMDYLRAYQLAFKRLGPPDAAWKERAGRRLDAFYPTQVREVNVELCKLISYLEVPDGVAKSMALLRKAPTQEEQIEYALALRTVKAGWNRKLHEEYFNWFHKAANYRGGHSFLGFMRNIRADAIKSLSPEERSELQAILAVEPRPTAPKFTYKKRAFVKKWTVAELLPRVESGLTGRNFDRGRNVFGEAKCFVCHRFNNEGGGTGPDLTIVSGRFGPRDLLESILEPSKVISDQYQAVVVTTTDGRLVTGRIVNLFGDDISINTDMLDPDQIVNVPRNRIESMGPSKVSMMPENLLDNFTRDEILDLVAYLYSRGDRNNKMFRNAAKK